MQIVKFDRVIGQGENKLDVIFDACRHDAVLFEEVASLVIRLGYKIEQDTQDDTHSELLKGPVTYFESF